MSSPTAAEPIDAFASIPQQDMLLRPWQTFGIPFASWGSGQQWDPQIVQATTINRYRKKFVQKIESYGGWVLRDGDDSMGYSFAAAGISMVVPLNGADNILLVTPRYRTDWIDGPVDIDVPPRLHSAELEIGWRYKFRPGWSAIIGVRPGVHSDFDTRADGFRLSGLGILTHELVPGQLSLVGGVVYLDRNDYQILPAVGATWTPTADWRIEATFPKPKISYRVGHIPFIQEDWVFLSGMIGGSTWSVLRSSGADDELTLRDFRVSLGVERIIEGGTGVAVELGYVFGRSLEYEIGGERRDFHDSIIIEAGLRF